MAQERPSQFSAPAGRNLAVQLLDGVGTVGGADERGVGRVDDHQILAADRGDQVGRIAAKGQAAAGVQEQRPLRPPGRCQTERTCWVARQGGTP